MINKMRETDSTTKESSEEIKALKQRIAELEALDEKTYKAAFESAGDIILLIDKMGKITDVNKRLSVIGGYEKEEFVGKNIKTLAAIMTAKSKVRIIRNFLKRMAGVNVSPYEVEIYKKNRELVTLEISAQPLKKAGKIIGDLVILREVTERKRIEEALKISEQNLRNLMDNSMMGIRARDADEQVWYSNQAFLDIFGYQNADEVKVNPPHERYTPESYQEYLLRQEKVARGEPVQDKFEVDVARKDGTIRHVQVLRKNVVRGGKSQYQTFYIDITEQKQMEEALKASEQNFRNSMDNSVMGIRITDIDDNTLYSNQAFLDIFEYKNIDEARTSPPLAHYTTESYAGYLKRKERLLRGEPRQVKVEVDILRKDGAIRHLQLTTGELFWNGKKQYQTFYNDITERKQAEQLYFTLAESTTGGVFIAQNGKFIFTNSVFQRNIGYTADELLTMGPEFLIHPEDKDTVRDNAVQMLKGKRFQPYVFRVLTKSGEIRWGLETVTSITYNGKRAMLGNFMDITERRQAEEALKLSEQNFRNSMDNSSIGIRISDKNDIVLYANQAMLDIFGYKNVNEMRTNQPQDYYSPEAHASWVLRHEKFLRGEPMPKQVAIDIIRKDGTVRNLDVSMMQVFWDGKKQYQTLYNDITERKQAEKALHESEEKYRLIVENSSDIIFTLNDAGEFIYLSPSVKNILGYYQSDLIGLPFRSLVHPDDLHIIEDATQTHYVEGGQLSGEIEYRFRHASGNWRWLVSTGTPLREKNEKAFNFIGVARDVTERKQAESRLAQAAQEWRTTFDSITDLISIHDKDNRFLRVNKAVADLLKITPKECLGKYCHEVMHGTKEPPSNCPHLQTLKTGKPAVIEAFNPIHEIFFHESTSPLLNEKGEVIGSVMVARDVTSQKRMEEQLLVTDRLASIGELASGIAHELNNPLTSVIGFSQLLMAGDIPPDIRGDLSTIYSEAQRAAVIVKNLLTFARKHAPVTELSQVNVVIDDVLRLRTYEQKVNNIEVEKHLANNLPEIMMDHFQIQQVFLNIIVNAEYSMLEAHNRGKLVISTEKVGDIIRITFADDGPGISKENMKKIFNPFFTTKEVGKGTGLGLSICHGIVTEHGGQIYAKSEIGQGATFIVDLPVNRQ